MIEIALIVFVVALTGVGAVMLTRPDARAIVYWTWGAFAILGSGIATQVVGDPRWTTVLGFSIGTAYPALLLVGAVVYAGRERPRGLITAGLLLGAARGLVATAGHPAIAHGLAVGVEPVADIAAAVIVYRANRSLSGAFWPHTLPFAFLGMAALEAVSAISMSTGGQLPQIVFGGWVVGSSLLLALQIAAVSDTSRDAELARSMAELRESESRYRTLSELSSDYSFAVRVAPDRNVEFVWASSGLERVTGFEAGELGGLGWLSKLPAEDLAETLRRLDDVIARRTREMDFRIIDRHGEEHRLHSVFESVDEEGGGTVLLVGATRDVTELKRAEEERRRFDLHMREVQRLESLGVLAGGIAHDFNNMLTVIRGNARLALADLEAGGTPVDRIERIRHAAEHATRLTEQMLTYSGRASVALKPLDLSQLVHGMLDLLRASVSEKAVLEPELAEGLPLVEGDVTQLRQVVLNLVTNASEALGAEGGLIRLRTGVVPVAAREIAAAYGAGDAAPGDYVCFEVSDTGQGIARDERARIFEPFFSTKTTGQGLGLAAVLGIVSAHRGVIRIDSALGRGTAFEVLLPRAQASAAARPKAPDRNRDTAGRGVLVVDDDPAVLEVAGEFLERAGFRVFTAEGGAAGVDLLRARSGDIDAVVLDMVMPGVGGEQAYVEMLRVRPDLPVLLTSGFDRENAAVRVESLGVVELLVKPYEPEDLIESVRRALAR